MMEWLIQEAKAASQSAYAPYSEYRVGAAVMGDDGRAYLGCNVENASYGLSICAERNAVFAMVAAGCRKAVACAVATRDGALPCGACLQVLLEFAQDPSDFLVGVADESGDVRQFTLKELLPHGFRFQKQTD
jgi:cytidine deaminase